MARKEYPKTCEDHVVPIDLNETVYRTYTTGLNYLTYDHPANLNPQTRATFQHFMLRAVGGYLVTDISDIPELHYRAIMEAAQDILENRNQPQRVNGQGRERFHVLYRETLKGQPLRRKNSKRKKNPSSPPIPTNLPFSPNDYLLLADVLLKRQVDELAGAGAPAQLGYGCLQQIHDGYPRIKRSCCAAPR